MHMLIYGAGALGQAIGCMLAADGHQVDLLLRPRYAEAVQSAGLAVTGIFGDLLSYIRLFALGVASSILGLVVNQMAVAFGKAPYVGPVIFFLIIVIGHTANLAISSLGAFVHPMRLTFVEFYKNAGFKGGGKAYQPFAKQKNHESF